MALGIRLSQSFGTSAAAHIHGGKPVSEIKLFRFLKEALCSIGGYRAGEIHGNKYQVTYQETQGWFTKTPRCELGDICIIAYSRRKKKARLVIMQNKVARAAKNSLSTYGGQINASLVQHELLSTRPSFDFVRRGIGGKANDMIRATRYPSVCVYGNFYKNGKGEADMTAITANQFQFKNAFLPFPNPSRHPMAWIAYNGSYECFALRNGSGDFVAAENLTDFGDLLEDLYIGKPIGPKEKAYIEKELKEAFDADPSCASNMFLPVMRDFQMTDLPPEDDYADFRPDDSRTGADEPAQEFCNPLHFCRSLLLINVDYEESLD